MTTSKHGEDGVMPLPSAVRALSAAHLIQIMGIACLELPFSSSCAKKITAILFSDARIILSKNH
jgi:hypothetical protein